MNYGIFNLFKSYQMIIFLLYFFQKVKLDKYNKHRYSLLTNANYTLKNHNHNFFNFKELKEKTIKFAEINKKTVNLIPFFSMLYVGKFRKIKQYFKNSNIIMQISENSNEENNDLFLSLVNFLRDIIAPDVINNSNISEACKSKLEKAYINKITTFYYLKIILDSTKNKNDVGSFNDCFSNDYGYKIDPINKTLEYVVVNYQGKQNDVATTKFNTKNIGEYENGFFIFGICMIKGCNNSEIKEILKKGNDQINVLNKFEKEELQIYSLDNEMRIFSYEDILYIIPLIFILIQVVIIIFPSIPAKVIICCKSKFRKSYIKHPQNNLNVEKSQYSNRSNEKNFNNVDNKITYSNEISTTNHQSNNYSDNEIFDNENKFKKGNQIGNEILIESPNDCLNFTETYEKNQNKIINIFSFKRNIHDLFLINFSKETINPTYDFSSMGYVTGLRGIAMFSILIGYVYLILFESPIKIYCRCSYFKLIRSTLYNIISSGVRISPRILFTCSGYCMAYKILNYFDKKIKKINGGDCDDQFFDEHNFITCEDNSNKKFLINYSDNINSNSEKNNYTNNSLPFKCLISFLMKQFHKYLLYVLTLLFFKFFLFAFFAYFGKVGPIWLFFKKNVIDSLNCRRLIYQIFLIDSIADFNYQGKNYIYLFWFISLEIKFFIFTSCLIFLAYRRNNRLDIVIFAFIPFSVIIKIVFYFISKYLLLIDFFPTIFYSINYYNFISLTPYYNYSYYLIGVIFGSMNYIHQKSLSYDEIRSSKKSFLILPLKCYNLLLNFHHSTRKMIKFSKLFLIFIGIFIAFSQKTFLIFMGLTDLNELDDNYFKYDFLNCYYLIDKDLFIIILFFVCSGIARTESNFLSSILKSNFWIFKNKIYFGYMMTMNLVIFYLSYQSESRIKIEFFNVLFLSIVCYMNIFICSGLFYIFFDAPYKKLNRYLLKEKS